MRRCRTDFDGELLPFTKLGLPLAQSGDSVTLVASDPGGIMPKFIRRGLDALLSLAEQIGAVTLPAPKLIPIKVVAGKSRR